MKRHLTISLSFSRFLLDSSFLCGCAYCLRSDTQTASNDAANPSCGFHAVARRPPVRSASGDRAYRSR